MYLGNLFFTSALFIFIFTSSCLSFKLQFFEVSKVSAAATSNYHSDWTCYGYPWPFYSYHLLRLASKLKRLLHLLCTKILLCFLGMLCFRVAVFFSKHPSYRLPAAFHLSTHQSESATELLLGKQLANVQDPSDLRIPSGLSSLISSHLYSKSFGIEYKTFHK